MSEHYVVLSDGAKVYVKLLGDDDRSRPLLIVLHGAPGLSTHAEPESSFGFLQTTFRVLVYDARGSGVSDKKGPYTDARWVQDADELRAWAGAEKVVLAGGSYGGFVAQQYALAHPSRLVALVLRDTWSHGFFSTLNVLKTILTSDKITPDADRQVRMWSGSLRDDDDFREGFREIAPLYAAQSRPQEEHSTNTREEAHETLLEREEFFSATQNAAFSFNVPRFDVRARLRDISVPTLVVHGRTDLIVPLEAGREIANGIPGARLVVFDHSGHSPPSDETEKFRATLREFLSAVVA